MSEAAIKIEGVTKRFGTKTAVNKLDLVVPTGSVCGFLGPNGAGKTTTIRMVMSIFYPDEGNISVLDKASAAESKDRIGYLPEERGVYRTMKVGEFLTYLARLKGVPSGGLKRKIEDWLERLELPGVYKKRCEELSKGMQQKVQFLAAIVHDPELVILDEPFSGLDPVNARLLRSLIDELHGEGKTIIFSTHVLASAEQVCDRIFLIDRGKKVLDGSIDGVRARFDPKTVLVEGPEIGQSERSLADIVGVHSVSHMRVTGRAPGLELHLEVDADPQEVIREAATRAPVTKVELRRATLEDIFVQLVDRDGSEDTIRAALQSEGEAVEVTADA